MMSPSCTSYERPSMRSLPAARTAASVLPWALKSAQQARAGLGALQRRGHTGGLHHTVIAHDFGHNEALFEILRVDVKKIHSEQAQARRSAYQRRPTV